MPKTFVGDDFNGSRTCNQAIRLLGPHTPGAKTFNEVVQAVGFDTFDYRPYWLRRGGATHLFQVQGRFDSLLVLGRWQASATARIYLNEGLATLAEMTLPWTRFTKSLRSQYLKSLTKPLPKLELTKQTSQKRVVGKEQKTQGSVKFLGEGLQLLLGLAGH